MNTLELKTDNPEHVIENRRRIVEALGGGVLQFNQQTHSTIVHQVKEKTPLQVGDALITQMPRLLIGIQTADCMPILMAHKTQKIVAAVHAGWKGALTGIVQSTLNKLQKMCDLKDLVCVVGPCIATDHLEVGEDVYDLVQNVIPGMRSMTGDPFIKSKTRRSNGSSVASCALAEDDKWNLNLRTLAAQIMQDYGIIHIDQIQEDTYSQPDKFFSYRRSTHAGEKIHGGQASVIGIL